MKENRDMKKRTTLRELMEKECVLAPCVYDCASARAAEMSGFNAIFLSGAELSMAMDGMPDIGVLNLEELLWMTRRITEISPLPLTVDIEDGFGGPLNVYRTCENMVRAGAMGVLLEDENAPGFVRSVVESNLLPRKEYLAKVKAAVDALEGTDCLLMARTNVAIDTPDGMDEAIGRALDAFELGADMVVINRLKNLSAAREVANRVPGWKVYPDLNQDSGMPPVRIEEIESLGYRYVTMHYMLKAAMAGMLEWGDRNFADKNNLYSLNQTPRGIAGQSAQPFFNPQQWLDFEARYTGVPIKFWGPLL